MGNFFRCEINYTYIGYFADVKDLFSVSGDEKPSKKPKQIPNDESNSFISSYHRDEYYDLGYHIRGIWDSFVANHPKWSECEQLDHFHWEVLEHNIVYEDEHRFALIFGFPATNHLARGYHNYHERNVDFAKIRICDETGVISVTPSFPPNCRELLIEFLTDLKFKIHGEEIKNKDKIKKKMEEYRYNVDVSLKFGVSGSLEYDS